ncbi:MAG: type II secretion system major pseudopilin GspG [Thermoguttaceae bacterium]
MNTTMNRRNRRNRNRSAFTLIEVMIVLFIIMIIAGMGVISYQTYMESAKKRQAAIFVQSLDTPLQKYALDVGHFPTVQEGLNALLECPPGVDPAKWEGPYIEARAAKNDPWDQPYQYVFPGSRTPGKYDLWSFGPDMMDGTEDDIGNWQ